MTAAARVVPAGYDRSVHLVDEVLVTAPLALRFWDPVLDLPVREGLRVHATPAAGGARRAARTSSSGLYGFHSLPTTRSAERGAVADFDDAQDYRVTVTDPRGRFVAAAFTLSAPAAGVQPAPGEGVEAPARGFFLFSAHARPVPPGCLAVRADLRDASRPVPGEPGRFLPAAHALAAVEVDGSTWYGVSDDDGRLLVALPAPVFATATDPAVPRAPRTQRWPVTITVRYAGLAGHPDGGPPDLGDVAAQDAAEVDLGTEPASGTAQIAYGQELVLRSPDRSDLLVTPA